MIFYLHFKSIPETGGVVPDLGRRLHVRILDRSNSTCSRILTCRRIQNRCKSTFSRNLPIFVTVKKMLSIYIAITDIFDSSVIPCIFQVYFALSWHSIFARWHLNSAKSRYLIYISSACLQFGDNWWDGYYVVGWYLLPRWISNNE